MSIRNLNFLFDPKSIAVIGASSRAHSVGETVFRNLASGSFSGALYPVNPKYASLLGHEGYASVAALPEAPQLAVICTPPASVPGLIAELGARGTKAAIVLTAGLDGIRNEQGVSLRQAMLDAARPHLLRILGPNCVGMLTPGIGVNASFAPADALPGKIAFVSQSGALVTAILDWANARRIGFSRFVSLGEGADVDVGDLLDYLADDGQTSAILLYLEEVRNARKFMSAARGAARSKPVLVVKAGRMPEGARAAASHTGALAGTDAVYDAAIRRAGMLRVLSTDALFGAVQTLARARPLRGERLAIFTNGGGPAVMATDALVDSGGKLATLSPDTLTRLDAVLPATWSHGNPIDIIGDAPVERYVRTLEILLQDGEVDAILFIHAPTAIVPSIDIANAIMPLVRQSSRNVLACWLGGNMVAPARDRFAAAGLPTYDTPEDAIAAFMQLVDYRHNQQLLMEVPPAVAHRFVPDRAAARAVIQAALDRGQSMLGEADAKIVLASYGIPVVDTRVAGSVEEAVQLAGEIGYPVALKVLSPEVSHKTDVGGVVLDLASADAVRAAAQQILQRVGMLRPEAHLQGFAVQQMARRPQSHELIAGVTTDPVFGPVILFGQGGIAVEVTADHAVALPPLNMVLARELVSRTRVSRLLAGYRDRPPADLDAICQTLIQLSHLVTDLPELVEVDINPLLADSAGVIALDARMKLMPVTPGTDAVDRLAIRPYPEALEKSITWQGGTLEIRPIRPEDGEQHLRFFNALDPEDVRYRAFMGMRELQPSQLARLTQIDYDREMAFIATRTGSDGIAETLGVARAISDPDNVRAEFAVIVGSNAKGLQLGRILMTTLIDYCRRRGTQRLVGEVMSQNTRMLRLARTLGFTIDGAIGEEVRLLRLDLNDAPNGGVGTDSKQPAA